MSIGVSAMPVQLSGHEHLTGPMTTALGDEFIHGKERLHVRWHADVSNLMKSLAKVREAISLS